MIFQRINQKMWLAIFKTGSKTMEASLRKVLNHMRVDCQLLMRTKKWMMRKRKKWKRPNNLNTGRLLRSSQYQQRLMESIINQEITNQKSLQRLRNRNNKLRKCYQIVSCLRIQKKRHFKQSFKPWRLRIIKKEIK